MSILASNNANEIRNELIKNSGEQTSLDQSMGNLYMILLQYYTLLIKNNHPKVNLITDVLDLLIDLKNNPPEKDKLKESFDVIHGKAYNNIQTIYDYDKENDKQDVGYLTETNENTVECSIIPNDKSIVTN
jgi:hypothetical protein